jgi:hypothetical protein
MSASERWKKKKAGVEEDPQEKKNKVGTAHIIFKTEHLRFGNLRNAVPVPYLIQ